MKTIQKAWRAFVTWWKSDKDPNAGETQEEWNERQW